MKRFSILDPSPKLLRSFALLCIAQIALLLQGVASADEGPSQEPARGTLRVSVAIPSGPAASAGVEAGDLLLRVGERPVKTFDALQKALASHQAGDDISLWVERGEEDVELRVVLGPRSDGGVSLGVQLEVELDAEGVPDEGTEKCLAQIEETYKVSRIIERHRLDFLAESFRIIRTCMERDTRRMTTDNAVRFCENVFKVHCSGDQLLGELGEAQVEACEQSLRKDLKRDPRQDPRWTQCAKNKIFEAYSLTGKLGDLEACRAAYEGCPEPDS